MKTYTIQNKETGNILDNFDNIKEAENTLYDYEESDKKEGIFVPDFYEIKETEYEIYPEDIGRMTWDKAMIICAARGDGWRLPTKFELNLMYEDKYKIGGFINDRYWSNTDINSIYAWFCNLYSGYQNHINKNATYYVRPIRTITV